MLLKTLQQKIFVFYLNHPTHEESRKLAQLAKSRGILVHRMVNEWDAREIGSLRDIVPSAFPRKLRKGPLVAELNIHGKWQVKAVPVFGMPDSWDPARRQDSGGYYG